MSPACCKADRARAMRPNTRRRRPRGLVSTGQQDRGSGRGGPEVFHVTQSLGLDREGMVLAGLWVDAVDALQTHRECGRLLGPFAGVGAEFGEFSLCVGMVPHTPSGMP